MKYRFVQAFILFCFLAGAVPANAAISTNPGQEAGRSPGNVWAYSESEKFTRQFSLTVNLLLVDIPGWIGINAGGRDLIFDLLIDYDVGGLPGSPLFSGSVLHRLPPILHQK